MQLIRFSDAAAFLARTQAALEEQEAANNLMLGVARRLEQYPERIKTAPYLAAVADERGLALVALMTPPFNLVLHAPRDDWGDALEPVARDLNAPQWSVRGVLAPVALSKAFAETWARVAGVGYRVGMRQRVFELRRVIPPPRVQGRMRLATTEDVDLVAPWIDAFQREALGETEVSELREFALQRLADGAIYLWETEQPVAMAAKSRPTRHSISVNLVYTPPAYRRRGYASALVAALSQAQLDAGYQSCTLFTDLANPTSNHIYQAIGYAAVGDADEYRFE